LGSITFIVTIFLLHYVQGVGALYIVMDALKRRRAEEKEKAERQREEEEFHNKMNRGRQILPPLL